MVKTNCPDTEVSYLLCNPTRAAPAGRVEFGTGCSSNIPLGITENHGFKAFFFFFWKPQGKSALQHVIQGCPSCQAALSPWEDVVCTPGPGTRGRNGVCPWWQMHILAALCMASSS